VPGHLLNRTRGRSRGQNAQVAEVDGTVGVHDQRAMSVVTGWSLVDNFNLTGHLGSPRDRVDGGHGSFRLARYPGT
jgi:hypothetical protein